jgi:alginate O-acetyltransferase complex protein AlgI
MPHPKARFLYALGMSAVFHYHFAGPAGVLPIAVMATITFFLAQAMDRQQPGSVSRRRLLALGLLVPVGGLLFYKYQHLLVSSLGEWLPGKWGEWSTAHAFQPALPLAISFFTFEFVHYLTDIYHRKGAPVRDPFRFAFFCIFFPSIVSGPIKRFQPFLAQLEGGLARPALSNVALGAAQVLLGFFKKLVVADNATLVLHLMEERTDLNAASMVLFLFLLSVRILFDFSGYSDIAIGLGRMIGLELPRNFNFPYWAPNLTDFWRRWHMSLSSWIRDYIYIPLGGNRYGPTRKFLNLMVTMFVCGLWHGASWHFGVWGLYHGLGLAIHSVWENSSLGRRWAGSPAAAWVGRIVNNLFVAYGWLIFFYPLEKVARFTGYLFNF